MLGFGALLAANVSHITSLSYCFKYVFLLCYNVSVILE
jgi:hypothetical protein